VRTLDFDALHLKARDGGTVTLDGRLATGCWDSASKALDVTFVRRRTVVETETAMYRDKLTKMRAALATAQELTARMQPLRLREALAAVADRGSERAVLVSDIDYRAPDLKLHGVALGAAARETVEHSLRGAGFEATRIDWSPAGDCRAFTATTRVTGNHTDADDLVPGNIFDERTTSLCAAPSGPAVAVTAHGSGDLTLHLRGADVTGVFRILNDLSPADGFIVQQDVRDRVDVDLISVTVGEALAALRSAGVAFATDGPLHRVCRTTCPELPTQKYDGEPVSFSVTGADVGDVIGAFTMLTSLKMHVPRDLHGTVSMYVHEAPWDLVLASLVSTLQLTYSIDGMAVYFGPDRAATVPLEKITRAPSRRELIERNLDKLGAEDLRLAAIAGLNGSRSAYARAPGSRGLLLPLAAGTKLFDASVEGIAADKVTLRTKSGREIALTLR